MKEIRFLENFLKSVKKLQKKYGNIKEDIEYLEILLTKNPEEGVSLGGGMYKVRIPNSSKNTGKRGGFRVITYYKSTEDIVYLVEIYDKSTIENIPLERLRALFSS